jgi:hypothetical protein
VKLFLLMFMHVALKVMILSDTQSQCRCMLCCGSEFRLLSDTTLLMYTGAGPHRKN